MIPPSAAEQIIVGDDMTDQMWDTMLRHARTCAPGEKLYAYSGANGTTIYVDSLFRGLFRINIHGVEYPVCQLEAAQRVSPFVCQLEPLKFEQKGRFVICF